MQHADALSRSPVEDPSEVKSVAEDLMILEISNSDFLVTLQRQDSRLVNIIDILLRDPTCAAEEQVKNNYLLEDYRLFRKIDGRKCFVVPSRVRWRMIKSYHDDKGHVAEEKVLAMIKDNFWFPKMRKYIRSYIDACPKCAYFKEKGGKPEGWLNPIPKTPIPFHTIHLDHLGPFIKSTKGNEHILVSVCGFTKFVYIKAVRSTKTQPVIDMLEEMACIFGMPSRIVTDRGTAFTSIMLRDYCKEYGIDHVLVAVGTPRGNVQVERSNRTILAAIRTMVDTEEKHWDKQVKLVQHAINSMPNDTTKEVPTKLILSYKPRDVVNNEIIAVIGTEREERREDRNAIVERVVRATQKGQKSQKKYFNKRRKEPTIYKLNDLVLVVKDQFPQGGNRKLEPKYKGPWIVTKVLDNDRYQIESIPETEGRRYASVYSADRMKKWCTLEELESENESEDEDISELGVRL
uniref:RNA-directed DNA polymerase n=1 Tax=Anopheles atroparvus TaxID=41427 RepID=A0AAG5DS95_ANOAO